MRQISWLDGQLRAHVNINQSSPSLLQLVLLCICVFVLLFLVTCKWYHHPSSTMRHWVLWLCLCLFYAYFNVLLILLAKYMNMNIDATGRFGVTGRAQEETADSQRSAVRRVCRHAHVDRDQFQLARHCNNVTSSRLIFALLFSHTSKLTQGPNLIPSKQ